MRALFLALVVCFLPNAAGLAQDPKPSSDYFRLTFEAQGRLDVKLVPKSGEVTSASLTVEKQSWTLDLSGVKGLKDAAKKLDGQTVLVEGEFLPLVSLESRSTESRVRHNFDFPTLRVTKLKAAEKRK